MAEHENQRIRLTKRLIKESLFDLLQTNTISDISVTHLAKNAGINRSTFYVHYHDQYEVLEELGYDFVHKIANVTQSEQNLTLADQVAETSRYFKDNIEQTRFLMANFQADSPVIQELMAQRFAQISNANSAFNTKLDVDTKRLLQAFMVQGIYSLIRTWFSMTSRKRQKKSVNLQIMAYKGWIHLAPNLLNQVLRGFLCIYKEIPQ